MYTLILTEKQAKKLKKHINKPSAMSQVGNKARLGVINYMVDEDASAESDAYQIGSEGNNTFDLENSHVLNENEGTNMKKARKYLESQGVDDPNKRQEILDRIRHDIPNARLGECKFLAGVTRLYMEGQIGDANKILQMNQFLKYLADPAHINEYDHDLNGMSFDALSERFSTVIADLSDERMAQSLAKERTPNTEYTIVPIPDAQTASKYGQYTSWCVTHSSQAYNSYTSDGAGVFYFCLKNGFENIPEVRGEHCPLDEYGLSMIAVSVDDIGEPNTITCRWNHANGGSDAVMDYTKLEDILGVSFYKAFPPRDRESAMKKRKEKLQLMKDIPAEFQNNYNQLMNRIKERPICDDDFIHFFPQFAMADDFVHHYPFVTLDIRISDESQEKVAHLLNGNEWRKVRQNSPRAIHFIVSRDNKIHLIDDMEGNFDFFGEDYGIVRAKLRRIPGNYQLLNVYARYDGHLMFANVKENDITGSPFLMIKSSETGHYYRITGTRHECKVEPLPFKDVGNYMGDKIMSVETNDGWCLYDVINKVLSKPIGPVFEFHKQTNVAVTVDGRSFNAVQIPKDFANSDFPKIFANDCSMVIEYGNVGNIGHYYIGPVESILATTDGRYFLGDSKGEFTIPCDSAGNPLEGGRQVAESKRLDENYEDTIWQEVEGYATPDYYHFDFKNHNYQGDYQDVQTFAFGYINDGKDFDATCEGGVHSDLYNDSEDMEEYILWPGRLFALDNLIVFWGEVRDHADAKIPNRAKMREIVDKLNQHLGGTLDMNNLILAKNSGRYSKKTYICYMKDYLSPDVLSAEIIRQRRNANDWKNSEKLGLEKLKNRNFNDDQLYKKFIQEEAEKVKYGFGGNMIFEPNNLCREQDSDAYPFAIFEDNGHIDIYIGKAGANHNSICPIISKEKGYEIDTTDFERARFWTDHKYITFWDMNEDNISQEKIRHIIDGLNNAAKQRDDLRGENFFDYFIFYWKNPDNEEPFAGYKVSVRDFLQMSPNNVTLTTDNGMSTRDFWRHYEYVAESTSPSSVDLSSFKPQDKLNNRFWKDDKLDSKIRLKLMDIADDFLDTLDVKWAKPKDTLMTGSLANYNWNRKYSDIDLHILMDFKDIDERTDFVKHYCDSQKNLWNKKHKDLKICGFPVEVYVQDVNEEHDSTGIYSLDKDKWIKKPAKKNVSEKDLHKDKIRKAVASYMDRIDEIEENLKKAKIDSYEARQLAKKAVDLFSEIRKQRTSGSSSKKEMTDGNIIFKALRRLGYLDKLDKLRNRTYDKENSLNESTGVIDGCKELVDFILDHLMKAIENSTWDKGVGKSYKKYLFSVAPNTFQKLNHYKSVYSKIKVYVDFYMTDAVASFNMHDGNLTISADEMYDLRTAYHHRKQSTTTMGEFEQVKSKLYATLYHELTHMVNGNASFYPHSFRRFNNNDIWDFTYYFDPTEINARVGECYPKLQRWIDGQKMTRIYQNFEEYKDYLYHKAKNLSSDILKIYTMTDLLNRNLLTTGGDVSGNIDPNRLLNSDLTIALCSSEWAKFIGLPNKEYFFGKPKNTYTANGFSQLYPEFYEGSTLYQQFPLKYRIAKVKVHDWALNQIMKLKDKRDKLIYRVVSQKLESMENQDNPQMVAESKEHGQTVYLMVGIPGSGKSTWIKNNLGDIDVVSRDIIRAELGFTRGVDEKAVCTREQEQQVTDAEYARIKELADSGNNFVIDDTNTGKFRAKMIEMLRSCGLHIIVVRMDTDIETCIRRRNGQIPADIMRKIHAGLVEPQEGEYDDIIHVPFKDDEEL